jgi:hypothetical protein
VDEFVVQEKTATIKDSYAALMETMQKIKMGNLNQVPAFIPNWCAQPDESGHWKVVVLLPLTFRYRLRIQEEELKVNSLLRIYRVKWRKRVGVEPT